MLSILYGKKLKNEKIYVSVVSLVLFFSFLFYFIIFFQYVCDLSLFRNNGLKEDIVCYISG